MSALGHHISASALSLRPPCSGLRPIHSWPSIKTPYNSSIFQPTILSYNSIIHSLPLPSRPQLSLAARPTFLAQVLYGLRTSNTAPSHWPIHSGLSLPVFPHFSQSH